MSKIIKHIIISKYIPYAFQSIFKNTTAKIFELFIYLSPFYSKEVLHYFAARLIFLKLSCDCVTPCSSLPIKWSPISLASYLRTHIIWPQTSRPTLSDTSSLYIPVLQPKYTWWCSLVHSVFSAQAPLLIPSLCLNCPSPCTCAWPVPLTLGSWEAMHMADTGHY